MCLWVIYDTYAIRNIMYMKCARAIRYPLPTVSLLSWIQYAQNHACLWRVKTYNYIHFWKLESSRPFASYTKTGGQVTTTKRRTSHCTSASRAVIKKHKAPCQYEPAAHALMIALYEITSGHTSNSSSRKIKRASSHRHFARVLIRAL